MRIFRALFLLALFACEDTGFTNNDSGTAVVGDGGSFDGFRPPASTITYTPDGCSYEVSTPMVAEAGRSGDALGTTPAPGFIHASFVGPAESSFAVNWRTGPDTTFSRVLYGTDEAAVMAADAAGAGVLEALGHHALFRPLAMETNPLRIHETHVCGLMPDTTYYYKVGGPGAWSEVFDIATAPMPGSTSSFRFAVSGDSRNDSVVWAGVQERIATAGVDFQLFSGDAVVLGISQAEWDGFFGGTAMTGFNVVDSLARIPLMPANGNHDGLAVNYLLQFALPQEVDGDEFGQGEEWYSFDYGNAHFVVLNDSTSGTRISGVQAAWLEADLTSVNRTTTPWVFVMHHKPAYSCSTNHGSDLEIRREWQPIYDRFNVDMVFNGHDHCYERSLPVRGFQEGTSNGVVAATGPNGIPVDESGTVYVVAAGAGAPLYGVDDSCNHTHITESVVNFLVIEIEDRTMRYQAIRGDGSMLDEFEYTK
jgi:hypothetical protein